MVCKCHGYQAHPRHLQDAFRVVATRREDVFGPICRHRVNGRDRRRFDPIQSNYVARPSVERASIRSCRNWDRLTLPASSRKE